jgi:hypothetical protein
VPARRTLLEFALFVGVAVIGVMPAVLQPRAMVGDGVDAFGTWWFFDWIRLCVEGGGDPSFTRFFFWPHGKDNFAHTGNNFVDAVLSVPLQWVFGTRYQPLWIVLVMVGNAATFRPLAQRVLTDPDRAFAATLLWTVNPYTCFEITAGRPTQAFLWFVPAVPYFLIEVLRGGGWRAAVKLGVAAALVGWSYWFQAFFVALLCLPLLVWELRRSPDRPRALLHLGGALLVALLVVAPAGIPMARLWAGGGTPGGTPFEQSIFTMPGALGNSIGDELYGLSLMEGYGAPMLTLWTWGVPMAVALFSRRLPPAWWAGALLCVAVGFGPGIRLGDTLVVNVPYMVLYRYVPFFNRLWFPYRLVSCILLVGSLGIAAALPARRLRLWVVILAALGLWEQGRTRAFPFTWHDVRAPELLVEAGKEGGALIFLPFRIQHDGLIWQTSFRLPTFGGMGEPAPILWPPTFKRQLSTPIAQGLRMASAGTGPLPRLDADALHPLSSHGFRWVALRRDIVLEESARMGSLPSPELAVLRVEELIGAPVGVDGATVLWDLEGTWQPPERFRATAESLAATGWTASRQPAWTRALAEQGREGRPAPAPR